LKSTKLRFRKIPTQNEALVKSKFLSKTPAKNKLSSDAYAPGQWFNSQEGKNKGFEGFLVRGETVKEHTRNNALEFSFQ
jgi:hypothetical protein